jgi:phage gp29-like protein
MAVSIPDTQKIEVLPAGAENTLHERLVRLCNAEMSKAVLGGDLTTESGTKGARSLGDTQREDQTAYARHDAGSCSATIKRDLLTPLVVLTFGEAARRHVPEFAPQVEPPPDPLKVAQVYGSFIEHGGHTTQRDYRDALGIPDPVPSDAANAEIDPDDGDELVQMPGTQAAADDGDDSGDSEKSTDADE